MLVITYKIVYNVIKGKTIIKNSKSLDIKGLKGEFNMQNKDVEMIVRMTLSHFVVDENVRERTVKQVLKEVDKITERYPNEKDRDLDVEEYIATMQRDNIDKAESVAINLQDELKSFKSSLLKDLENERELFVNDVQLSLENTIRRTLGDMI